MVDLNTTHPVHCKCAPSHHATTRAALLAALSLLPPPAFRSGWALYPGTAIGWSSWGRGVADLNTTHPVHCKCAPSHHATTRAALLAASCLLPSPAFRSGWTLYPGTAIGWSNGGRGVADLNTAHPVHCKCAPSHHATTRAALLAAPCLLPLPAFRSGRAL